MKRFLFVGLALLAACNQAPPATEVPKTAPVAPGPDLATLTDSAAPAALLAYGREHPGSEVLVRTRLGNIRVKLYDDTPIHKANFLLLARKGVFNETMFNRVVKDFAVQGGQTYVSRTIRLRRYRLPPEIKAEHFHKKGSLGMARYDDEQNPGRLSSNTDFYFVVGEKLDPNQSQAMAGRKLTPAQIKAYATVGGVPSLDGQYTVFGEIIEGQDVIDKIANEPVESDKWPVKDIPIKVEVVK
ncbi:peptidylprolyl isomerase [Hymenobacter arizonensis]|uniref:peptidylprolyl isomerase n=1 Tax=Hymenobacter arizonensis TaxID=1227077 RepID=A0A1I5Z162_HYMAR|nr:peptidylprolyl isomerase [Hymenobacter arizonensis]SFQ50191.1 peptidyl-prolyl cis-trans isomerase B (cyclophilin B) [Hymenobacter arizonensis]